MSEEVKERKVGDITARIEARKNLTLADLQHAVDTINNFTSMYRKAKMAIKSLDKTEGQAGAAGRGGGMAGMFGGAGGDPFTGMMMGAVEEAVKAQAAKMVEKKTAGMTVSESAGGVTKEELAEAQGGLEGGSEEGEEVEE
ncbi:hypothetical protein KAX02_00045 [candidate division WOR-3 bacterium]|nr:hypothetical protein [candidate division WOR-3 bacterium]